MMIRAYHDPDLSIRIVEADRNGKPVGYVAFCYTCGWSSVGHATRVRAEEVAADHVEEERKVGR